MRQNPAIAALMLGGNLGNTLETFRIATAHLAARVGEIKTISGVYRSAPWGKHDQPWFLNQAMLIETLLEPRELLRETRDIEVLSGRTEGERNGPRSLDIDILLYDDLIIAEPDLTIPHPRMHLRKFNLEPLSEIAGNWLHPVLGQTVDSLNKTCSDILVVKRMIPDEAK